MAKENGNYLETHMFFEVFFVITKCKCMWIRDCFNEKHMCMKQHSEFVKIITCSSQKGSRSVSEFNV